MESSGVVVDTSIFIAATCLVYNLSILTTNISHFQRIMGLQIENE